MINGACVDSKRSAWLWPANYLFCLLVFVASYNFDPPDSYDRYRHVERYDLISDNPIGFWEYYVAGDQKDFLFYVFMYFGDSLGLSHEMFFALVNSLSVFLMLLAFKMVLTSHGKKSFSKYRTEKIFWIFFITSFSYISLFSGVRFFLALSFFSLFVALFNRGLLLVSFFCLVLATAVHFAFVVFVLAFVFSFANFLMLPLFGFGCLMALSSLVGIFDIYSIVGNLGALTTNEALGDVSKSYSEFRGEVHRNLIFYIMNFWVFIPACFYVFKDKSNSGLSVSLFLTVFVMLFYVDNYPVFGRYFLAMIFILFCCVANRRNDSFKNYYFYMLGASSLIRFFLEFHDNFEAYSRSFF